MATIRKRIRNDGSAAYRAEIRIKQRGEIVHRESRTFDRLKLARDWSAAREVELQRCGVYGVERPIVTVGELIAEYIDRFGVDFGRSKMAHLRMLLKFEIAELDALALTSQDLIEHCMMRNRMAQPQTVLNDVVWLRIVFRTMRLALDLPLDVGVIDDAAFVLRRERLIARARQRDRRPTRSELMRLSRYFAARRRSVVPMLDIMWFAIFSGRRESEITRLLWADNDSERLTGMVRDLKHPRAKSGNHQRFKYTRSAWKIVERQPIVDDRIFPFNPRTISAYFTRACRILEIPDLSFHDLRHEATSRLFEAGYSIEQVQLFTLHEDWKNLKRYTHLRPEHIDH